MPARARVIRLCTVLPEVEVEEGQHIGFSVRGKRFAWLLEDHHGDGRMALNCKAPRGENAALAEREPKRFFLPSYLGSRGWVGVWLDTRTVDWDAVERLVTDAYLLAAPKRLAGQVAARDAPIPPAPPGPDSA